MFWKKKKEMKPTYAERYAQCVRENTPEAAVGILQAALDDKEMTELEYAILCLAIYDGRASFYFHRVVYLLNDRFPHSLYPIQAWAALFRAADGDYDGAALEARLYLRRTHDAGLLYAERPEFVDLGVAEAFLVLANLYTELGARAYSCRLLNLALGENVSLLNKHAAHLRRQVEVLGFELDQPGFALTNARWEEFFRTGYARLEELLALCEARKAVHLARRLHWIEESVRYGQKKALDFSYEVLLTPATFAAAGAEKPA